MLFSWVLPGLFILSPSTFVSADINEESKTNVFTLVSVVNVSISSQTRATLSFNTTVLARPLSSDVLHTKYYMALKDLSVYILDGNTKVSLDDCIADELTSPFLASYENGVLASLEVPQNESRVSANIKQEIAYKYNLNADIVYIQSEGVTNLISIAAETSELGDYDVLYNVQRQDVSDGYDIHVLKSFNSSFGKPVQLVSWNCDDNCNSDSHKEYTWAIQQSVHIVNRDNITECPASTHYEHAKYKPFKDSTDKLSMDKIIVIQPVASISTSLTPDFSNGSRKLIRREPRTCDASSEETVNVEYPNISKIVEALSCSTSGYDVLYGIYKMPLTC